MPGRDVQHLPTGFRLGVDQRVDRPALDGRMRHGTQGAALDAQAAFRPIAELRLRCIRLIGVDHVQALDPLLQLVGQLLIGRDLVDEAGLAAALGQDVRAEDAAVVDLVDIGEIEMPRQIAAAHLAIDDVEVAILLVVFDIGDDMMGALLLDADKQWVLGRLAEDLRELELGIEPGQVLEHDDTLVDPKVVKHLPDRGIVDHVGGHAGDDRAEIMAGKRTDVESHYILST